MKFLEENLVDSENEKILEIESEKLHDTKFVKIITDAFEKNGFKKANGCGRNDYFYGTDFSFKYGFRDYIKFAIKDKYTLSKDSNRQKFSEGISIVNKTSSFPSPKKLQKLIFRHTLIIDFHKIAEKIIKLKENKVELAKNKNVSKFKKDLALPWFVGSIQDVVEDFQKAWVGYRYSINGTFSSKEVSFNITSSEMTKKQFSETEFEDLKFRLSANIQGTKINNQNLTMVGLKNILGNFKSIKKFIEEETKKQEPIVKMIDSEITKLMKQKQELNISIDTHKIQKDKLKEELRQKISKFANELNNN